MNPLAIAKTATGLIVSVGAGAVVSNAIKASTPASTKVIAKIAIGVGGFVLSGMVGELATKYVNENIENGIQQFKLATDKTETPQDSEV